MTTVLERAAAPVTAGGSAGGWRVALRVARRELLRARGRTLLVLVMVLLPLTAVIALDTLWRTAEISVEESLPRELGDAQARVEVLRPASRLTQTPDLRVAAGAEAPLGVEVDEAALRSALAPGSRLLAVREGPYEQGLRTADGRAVRAMSLGVDLRDQRLQGPFRVDRGRAPRTPDEVAVSASLERSGAAVGSVLEVLGVGPRTVVGTVEDSRAYGPSRLVVGLPEAVGLTAAAPTRWFVGGPPVTWDDVRELNDLGAVVLSRAVLADPPPDDQVPDIQVTTDMARTAALLGLATVMAVLEVVLLAGPAFAVGARRQRRTLALLAASGGEPRHVRRVVLAQGLLVGVTATIVAVPLGLAVAARARAPLTRWSGAVWGPFDVSVRDLVLLALLGAGTALLSALAPAVLAARQPVVSSLLSRRVPRAAGTAVPTAAGVVLLGLGTSLSLAALVVDDAPELALAFLALPVVLGAVLLAPAVLAGVGRLAGRLPLPLRYAARDADRQRSRTAPAVAAITATVAAAVAFSVVDASDTAAQREQYRPYGPPGVAVVGFSPAQGVAQPDWPAVARAAEQVLPGRVATPVSGIALGQPGLSGGYEDVQLCAPGAAPAVMCRTEVDQQSWSSAYGASVLVGTRALDVMAPLVAPAARRAAAQALRSGAVVVFDTATVPETVELRRQRTVPSADATQETAVLVASARAPVVTVPTRTGVAPARAVVGEELARRLGGATTVGLVVGSQVTPAQQERLTDALTRIDSGLSVQVERGFGEDDGLVVLLVGLVAGLLVLAGTLAATSLALAESRPDFTTLGQLGSRPRTRRAVAGSYAAVLALAGGLLGVLAGLVPGVATAVAVTNRYGGGVEVEPGWTVDVPWLLLLGLLVLLPTVAAAVAAASARGGSPARARVRR